MKKPKLGQNFLVDRDAQQRIADSLGDVSQRTVIEIGPGHGAITDLLVPRVKRLIAVELDNGLAPELAFRYRNAEHVTVLHQDVLKADFAELVPEDETADVVGNLPYYITSDILFLLCKEHARLRRAVVMMQREVAVRVASPPGASEYGLLSATVQMYGQVENLFTLPPEAFSPPPDVYSSVLRMHFGPRFEELGIENAKGFDSFLKKCFAQKRKTLANNLKAAGYKGLSERWPEGIAPLARTEELSLEQMAELYRRLGEAGSKDV